MGSVAVHVSRAQQQFLRAPLPKLLVGGVGSGKTTAGVLQILAMPARSDGCVVAPTFPMLRDVMLPALQRSGLVRAVDKSAFTVVLVGDRRVLLRSATHPDRLRGLNLDWFWIDEACFVPEAVYDVLLGRLRQNPDAYWLTTTPRRNSWVYRRLVEPANTGISIIRATSLENPFIDRRFAASLLRQYGTLLAKQEVLAEWIDPEGTLFRAEWIRYSDALSHRPEAVRIASVDLAIARKQQSHYTALVVLSYHPHERLYQVDCAVQGRWSFSQQVERIRQVAEQYRPRLILIESNQYQRALAEHLAQIGLAVKPVLAKGKKEERIAALVPLYELGLITHAARFSELESQLIAYPDTEYDDLLDALAQAVQYAQQAVAIPAEALKIAERELF